MARVVAVHHPYGNLNPSLLKMLTVPQSVPRESAVKNLMIKMHLAFLLNARLHRQMIQLLLAHQGNLTCVNRRSEAKG